MQLGPRQLPATAATGQTYGERGAQIAAQRAVPMGVPGTPLPPGSHGPLDRPTERPDEPLTAGIPSGPGPGPEVLGGMAGDDVGLQLRALYLAHPNEDIRSLIEDLDSGTTF